MSIVEFYGLRISHRALMDKSKHQLISDYMQLLSIIEQLEKKFELYRQKEEEQKDLLRAAAIAADDIFTPKERSHVDKR